jgi:hypothetical protein
VVLTGGGSGHDALRETMRLMHERLAGLEAKLQAETRGRTSTQPLLRALF